MPMLPMCLIEIADKFYVLQGYWIIGTMKISEMTVSNIISLSSLKVALYFLYLSVDI